MIFFKAYRKFDTIRCLKLIVFRSITNQLKSYVTAGKISLFQFQVFSRLVYLTAADSKVPLISHLKTKKRYPAGIAGYLFINLTLPKISALEDDTNKSSATFVDNALYRFSQLVPRLIGHMVQLCVQAFRHELMQRFSENI